MGLPANSVVVLTRDSALDYLPPVRILQVTSAPAVSSEVLRGEEDLHGGQRGVNLDHAVTVSQVSATETSRPARSERRVRIFFGPPRLSPLRSGWGEA